MKPSKHTHSHTAGLRALRGQRNRCWQDRGSDTRVRFRVRQAYRWRISPPFFCGVDLAPGVTSCSTIYLTEELWQLHVVVGLIDGGTIAGCWPRGLHSAPAGTKRGGNPRCCLNSEFPPPRTLDCLLLTSVLSQLLTVTICVVLTFHFSRVRPCVVPPTMPLPACRHDRSLQVSDFILDAIVIGSRWPQHLF